MGLVCAMKSDRYLEHCFFKKNELLGATATTLLDKPEKNSIELWVYICKHVFGIAQCCDS